jgi:hypothetical protein
MDKLRKMASAPVSRRKMLVAGVAAGSASLLAATGAKAMIKVSQASVAYKKVATGDHNCGGCKLFEAPSSCRFVEGPISSDCACRIWLNKIG